MSRLNRIVLFSVFLLSGFCGLLYQVIWIRLAFTHFGVITPVLSTVISVFMLGLTVGSWAGGRWIDSWSKSTRFSAIWFYAVVEIVIGLGAFLVPALFDRGALYCSGLGAMNSTQYLATSALVLVISILPWCIAMGCTYPFVMAFVREGGEADRHSFSFLYLANVIGAMAGTMLTAGVLIEALGFRATLALAGCLNFLIGATAVSLGLRAPAHGHRAAQETATHAETPVRGRFALSVVLFTTGFVSMAMEVVWTRAFTPVLWTAIYSFAALLTVYLFATWVGSLAYRSGLAKHIEASMASLLGVLALVSFLPLILNDPRVNLHHIVRVALVLVSIVPFCGLLGYITPKLIDDYSGGQPAAGGRAYAINVVGCIIGPIVAGYFLLPQAGPKLSLILLALPMVVLFGWFLLRQGQPSARQWILALVAVAACGASTQLRTYEDSRYCFDDQATHREGIVRRDYVATTTVIGEGNHKRILVNGVGMTFLTPITKNMVHIPLATLEKPQNILVICFGMGTSFRAAVSWGIDVTTVELVPSVPTLFSEFFDDADAVRSSPNARIVIDDGRRFLNRNPEKYDVIVIDPAPPLEAAGTSLLYSKDFYDVIKKRLKPGGILQHWIYGGEKVSVQAVARTLAESFPYIEARRSIENVGLHFTCSMTPIPALDTDTFIARMPENARKDFAEWPFGKSLPELAADALSRKVQVSDLYDPERTALVTDDRPYVEYFLLRRVWNKLTGRHESMY